MTSAETTDRRRLTPEERDRLLSSLSSEGDRIMLRILLETGRPLEDLLGARFSDLDPRRGALRLGRRGSRDLRGRSGEGAGGGMAGSVGEVIDSEFEEVPLSPELLAAASEYGEKNPGKNYIFEGRCGKPVGPKWIRCAIEPTAERLGLGEIFRGRGPGAPPRSGRLDEGSAGSSAAGQGYDPTGGGKARPQEDRRPVQVEDEEEAGQDPQDREDGDPADGQRDPEGAGPVGISPPQGYQASVDDDEGQKEDEVVGAGDEGDLPGEGEGDREDVTATIAAIAVFLPQWTGRGSTGSDSALHHLTVHDV